MKTQMQQASEQLDQIQSLRAQGKSQQAIAEKLGLTQPVVSLVLKNAGTPPPPTHLVAADPQEMAASQEHLKLFLARKIAETRVELNDILKILEQAIANGWKSESFDRQSKRAEAKIVFYEKALAVVEAGYTLIPNFPISVFAIRVNRKTPVRRLAEASSTHYEPHAFIPDEKAAILPPGEGRYVSPSQLVERQNFTEKIGDKETKREMAWPVEFDSIEFPLIAAQPVVMQAAQRAMALRVFDDIGVCPPAKQPDPLIIGRISMKGARFAKTLSFLIAWHLDLREL